jgi:hypothetical protein
MSSECWWNITNKYLNDMMSSVESESDFLFIYLGDMCTLGLGRAFLYSDF